MKIKLAAGWASRALAGAGANVLLNGLGEQALIEDLLAELRSQYKVNAACSAADMSKSGDIAAMVAQAARDVLLAQAASERGQQLPVRLLPSAALSARSAWRTHSSASATAA